jgi:hypothetical protein
VKDIPPELMQRTAELARKHPGAFELSLMTFLSNVNDRFRPSTAVELVGPMIAHVELAFEQSINTLPPKLGNRHRRIDILRCRKRRIRTPCERLIVTDRFAVRRLPKLDSN